MRKKSEMQKANEEFVKTYDDSKYHWKSNEMYVTGSALLYPVHIEWLHN